MRICPPLLLCLCILARGDDFSSGEYASGGAAYLKRPASAQSAALGGAVTAWRVGLAGEQYNPAILDAADKITLRGSYHVLSFDRKLEAVDGAAPLGEWFVVGASYTALEINGFERRDTLGTLNGTFGDKENTLSAAIAGRCCFNLSWGARARYLRQTFSSIDKGTANGLGFDAGMTWQPAGFLCIGASVLNAGSRLWWATGNADGVVPEGRLGIAGLLLDSALILEADFSKPLRQPADAAAGIEFTIYKAISFRGGIASSIDLQSRAVRDPSCSFGLGIRYGEFGFDYALSIPSTGMGLAHIVSAVAHIVK